MIPPAKQGDSEDVSWALSTAQTSFGRGDLHEALKWLRRAAESASEADQDDRALEIAKAVADLSAKAGASRPPSPPASSRPPASARPPPIPPPIPSSPASAPRPASVAPRPLAVPATKQGPRPPSVAPKAPVAPPQAAPAEKRARRKSIPDEATDRVELPPKHDEQPPPTPRTAAVTEAQKKTRRRSRDDLTRASNADELEAMPTQSMGAHELPEFEENGSTKVGTPALRATLAAERGALPIMAAARVHLVKGPDGVVRISIAATENSVPVMVVPIEPGTDLSKLLG